MDDLRPIRFYLYPMAFAALCALVVFGRLLPLGQGHAGLPTPDLLLALTIAWMLRRPDYLPVWLIAAVFLLADMLFMRPPGLWTLLVVAMTEFLRHRQTFTRSLPFGVEFAFVTGMVAALAVGQWILQMLFVLNHPGLIIVLLQIPMTMLGYPLAVLVTQVGLGVRRPSIVQTRGFAR